MNSIIEIKEAILADYIRKAERWARKRLLQEVIEFKSAELELTNNDKLPAIHEKRSD